MKKPTPVSCAEASLTPARRITPLKRAIYEASITRIRLIIQANAVLPPDIIPLSVEMITAYSTGRRRPYREHAEAISRVLRRPVDQLFIEVRQ